jgi:hypothetical protein
VPNPPAILLCYRQPADLQEHFEVQESREPGGFLFAAVSRAAEAMAQSRDRPAVQSFRRRLPPEVADRFRNRGRLHRSSRATALIPVRLRPVEQAWMDNTQVGSWGWRPHGDVVVMSAEIELAAWTIDGVKPWTTFI